jgi:hypothetical protein
MTQHTLTCEAELPKLRLHYVSGNDKTENLPTSYRSPECSLSKNVSSHLADHVLYFRCFRKADHTFLQSTLADFPRTSPRQCHVVAYLTMTPRMQPTSLVIYRRCQKLGLCSIKTGCYLIGCYQR